ncbi:MULTISPECIES: replicative DNA helicase [Leptolyngbya]|nr:MULTISPECIES: replicative DNA helicase [Leptolyngbya]
MDSTPQYIRAPSTRPRIMVQEFSFQPANDRIPPQNLEAEESILGGILLDPEAITRVLDILKTEMFYSSAHQEIYRACVALHQQGSPTDLMSVTTWLIDREFLDKVGGQSKLVQLVDRTVSAVNIDQYAQLVIDKYLRRRLISAGHQISHLGHETSKELEKILDEAEQKVFSITQVRPNQGLVPTSDILTKTFSEIEERSAGMALPGLASGFYDLDGKTQGFQRSDLIIVAGRPSMGKCLAHDAELVLADGSISTIAEIYQNRQAQLLTLNDNWKFSITEPSAFVDDGIKPVFRVTTRLGRTVETTLSHPYLTLDGWLPLAHVKVGDRIAVPRIIDVFGTQTLRACEIKLLGYLIGDGCLTKGSPEFTNINPLIQADFVEAVSEFGDLRVQQTDSNGTRTPSFRIASASGGGHGSNALTSWLRTLNLYGKSAHEKTIPEPIFQLTRSHIALFLNRLFATDGWASVLASGQSQLGYATVSEKLARQIQHLLLRFGIIARLKLRRVKYQGERRLAWQLDITDARSIQTFITEIGIFGKEAALLQVEAAIAVRKYQTNRDLIPIEVWQQLEVARQGEPWSQLAQRAGIAGSSNIHVGKRAPTRDRLMTLATALQHPQLQELADSDVYWDEIVSIESVGEKQVYDLTIPTTHNFVANDICVHNTAFCLGLGRNIAAQYKLPVAVFSLEMSKEQIVQRLLASEARIESGRLRSGRIAQHDWEPLSNAIGQLSNLRIFIDDTPNISVVEMRSRARKLQAEQGGALGMILIDYLQLMEGNGSENRVQELSRITRALKGLARELNVPVIALSQLSRSVEARADKRPMMSDLRESGSIEQDADLVMMLYRDEYYNPDTPDRGIAEVLITKHRNGPTGTIKLLFEPQFTKFLNLAVSNRSTYE